MLLEPHDSVVIAPPGPVLLPSRKELRHEIAELELRLAHSLIGADPRGTIGALCQTAPGTVSARPAPRVLDAVALTALRDDLAERLRRVRTERAREADEREWHRRRLEDMLALPKAYKWHRVANQDMGEPGCGVWQVRPRLGIIGMLAGWWHVTVSSGCPLAAAASGSLRPHPESHRSLHYDPGVGRRSRKRNSTAGQSPPVASGAVPTKAPETLRPKARSEDAPPAPWGTFPLVEICIFAGIVLVVWGFFSDGRQSTVLIAGGVAFICIASLELTIREHLAGFRSHTTLLAVACAVAAMAPLFFAQVARGIVAAVGVVIGVLAYGILRRVFIRRAGGLGFRA